MKASSSFVQIFPFEVDNFALGYSVFQQLELLIFWHVEERSFYWFASSPMLFFSNIPLRESIRLMVRIQVCGSPEWDMRLKLLLPFPGYGQLRQIHSFFLITLIVFSITRHCVEVNGEGHWLVHVIYHRPGSATAFFDELHAVLHFLSYNLFNIFW